VTGFLEGPLMEKHPTRALIERSGVGYDALIPLTTHADLQLFSDRMRFL